MENTYGHQFTQYFNVGDADMDTGCSMIQRIRRRRMRKRALHASLQNPKDLFWDAVWIQPEDIIREVNMLKTSWQDFAICNWVRGSVSYLFYAYTKGSLG